MNGLELYGRPSSLGKDFGASDYRPIIVMLDRIERISAVAACMHSSSVVVRVPVHMILVMAGGHHMGMNLTIVMLVKQHSTTRTDVEDKRRDTGDEKH